MVPLGHAGDGGGSIRLPASVCGLFGLKPSRGRITVGPEVGEVWAGLVARLVVTRTVRDSAAVLDAVHGAMPGDPSVAAPPLAPYGMTTAQDPQTLRIGWTTASPDAAVVTDPEVAAAVEATARRLEALGHHVEEARPAVWDRPESVAELTAGFVTLMGVWVAAELDRLGKLAGAPITAEGTEAGTWAFAEMGRATSGLAYLNALDDLHASAHALAGWWGEGFDILLTPTTPELPWTLGQFTTSAGMLRAASIVQFTVPFNVTGQPAASIPAGFSEGGLPIGVQAVAAHGRDDLVLALAGQLERAHPWADHWPAVQP
jgi:amidase